jgi:hypothetical protein
MKASRISTAIVALLAVGGCAKAPREPLSAAEAACRPSFIRVQADEEAVVSVGAVLIGCKSDLDALDDADRTLLRNALHEAAGEMHFRMLGCETPEVRGKLSSRLNERLGRPIITDLACFHVSVADYIDEE